MPMSSERPTRIDTAALKAGVDLLAFAQRFTELRPVSQAGEYAGPCPRCGGEDRFHIKHDRFYCRQCYPRGGDVIDLAQLVYEADFREACRLLADDPAFFSERPLSAPVAAQSTPAEPEPADLDTAFQLSAERTVAATAQRLRSAAGSPGRTYLRQRGLSEPTWGAFRLGYGQTLHPTRQRQEPAIFIPWIGGDGSLHALRHRFLDATLSKGERYTLKPGSRPQIFGLHLFKPAGQVVIVEGEFNCLSLHQAGVAALSLGSETGALSPAVLVPLQAALHGVDRIFLWFDAPRTGEQLRARLAEAGPFRKKTIALVVSPQDANELLVAGRLAAVLAEQGIG